MWPLNLPARQFLKLPGATSVGWAVFDADWYRTTYASDTAHLTGASPDAVLAFYFGTGQGLGHSPNMLFDEAWHRHAYPAMAAVVDAGRFPSTFDGYCRGGCLERSPHWLFDETDYRRRNPDLTHATLADQGLVNGYDHYLWRGNAEGRIAHPLFDPTVYLAQLPPDEAAAAAADGPFWHHLRRVDRHKSDVRTSIYFDPLWYCERYPTVAEAIGRGTWRCALEHYLCNETPTQFDPNPSFSESYYLARAAGVAARVENRQFRNGYAHFLRHGIDEGLSPSEPIDLAWYGRQDVVSHDVETERAANAFAHWLTIGRQAGLHSAPKREEPISESQAKALFRSRARTLSVLAARTQLHFETTGAPTLSVIMVLHDQFDLTLMALGSLRANYPGDIELILVDSGSADETRLIERFVPGATYLRFDDNIGYLRGCNAGLTFATADAVLYLNNDIELAPGAIAAALRRLESDPRIGVVGGLVLRTNDVVQEAGNIVFCDGSTQGYMRDASPLAPEANFVRDVDFCSGVFLMARRTVLNRLEGFDEAFAPAYYEDADLCIRMSEAGFRVVYDPAVVVHHLEYGSATSSRGAEAEIGRARRIFANKHADFVASRPGRGERAEVFARMANTTQKCVLFLEDTIPLRMIGSGFVRSNDIVQVMAAAGYGVTVFPLNGCEFGPATVYADMPDSAEVMYDRSVKQLSGFLGLRRDYYDVIWVARTHNLDVIRPILEQVMDPSARRPLIVLDTEAIASLREAEQAAVMGETFDLDAALEQELRNASCAEKIVAVTGTEAATLRDRGFSDVSIIGHMRALCPTSRPFTQRTGMLFVGAIHRMDSPNYDGLCWFIDEVLPLIEQDLGWQTRLTVAGYTGPDVTLDRFRDHPRVTLRGTVADLQPLYDSHRMFVAPTRFAAGTPYKVYEAASFGLPAVATELLRRQLGWEDDRDLLTASAADPVGFARQAVALQRDETLWNRLREGALERLRQGNSYEAYREAIADLIGVPAVEGKSMPASHDGS
jgi:GT2 family glycosyltransferase/glycosyltransferase involved in cell wall biosynthesis